ncbi:hypothetical protein BJY16_003968 [Actinoplanes octamycinicus]|uniref:Uncharacterized protein n=1 Tax=Actinoplanes octamycinicus TaxID=135948 RepID=A0A7W7M843_9ACTN|nr:hypothetical protein [Actinoplanes octamycinicus]MBB4740509.1 hypothetical protein [Actinoplanes octamycinicus]
MPTARARAVPVWALRTSAVLVQAEWALRTSAVLVKAVWAVPA